MHNQAYFSIFTLIMPSKAIQFNKYSNCCWGTTRALLLSPTGSPRLSQLQSSSYASKNPGEAPCQSRICGRSLSGASRWPRAVGAASKSSQPCRASSLLQLGQLVLGGRFEAGNVEDSVYSSVYSAVGSGVDSRMASVCSDLSVEISWADVAVAWSLPHAMGLHAIKNK